MNNSQDKTINAIISASNKDALLKLRNINKRFRSSVAEHIRNKRVCLRNWKEKALALNGKVHLVSMGVSANCSKLEYAQKEVANYNVKDQTRLDIVKSVCPSMDCCVELQRGVEATAFGRVRRLVVHSANVKDYANLSFKEVDSLEFSDVKGSEALTVLSTIESVNHISFYNVEPVNELFERKELKSVLFEELKVTKPIKLPSVKKLELRSCKQAFNLECPNLVELKCSCLYQSEQINNWLASLTHLKSFESSSGDLPNCLSHLNSSLKCFEDDGYNDCELSSIDLKSKFPHLSSLILSKLKTSHLAKSNLKFVQGEIENNSEGELDCRLRKAVINGNTVEIFNSHPELLKMVVEVSIDTKSFNYELLPTGIKKITLKSVNPDSYLLKRYCFPKRKTKER